MRESNTEAQCVGCDRTFNTLDMFLVFSPAPAEHREAKRMRPLRAMSHVCSSCIAPGVVIDLTERLVSNA